MLAKPPVSADALRSQLIPANSWIIGPREDLLFFLGTPLILIALFGFAELTWTVSALGIFTTILAMGHYLPGLMRTYGDPALFRRFPARFILAPMVLIGTAIWMANREIHAFLIVVVAWGAWHWLMQTYGLVRIYDAKAKNFDSTSAWLDYSLCIAWFGVLYWRTDGMTGLLLHYYRAGGLLAPTVVHTMAGIWMAATLAISVLYLLHMGRRWRAGHPPSVLKIVLLAVSFFFYLYAFGYSSSKLIAFGLFESYHDIQYLAIVWIFNRTRAEKDAGAGSFTRFLFQQRGLMIVFYVMLCLGFGSYDFFARSLDDGQVARAAIGVITGLALVHFYFDGFIWRIREAQTRESLGVEGGEALSRSWQLSPAVRHGMLWVAICVPVFILGFWELRGGRADDTAACRKVLAVRPTSHKAHYLIGSLLRDAGNYEDALEHAQRSRELRPGYDLYEMLYADVLMARKNELSANELDEVIACYETAAKSRSTVANLHLNWGKALSLRGNYDEAALRYQAAIELDPAQTDPRFEMGVLAARNHDYDAAAQYMTEVIRLDSNHVDARSILGTICMAQGREKEALAHYDHALELDPNRTRVLTGSASILASSKNERIRDPDEATKRARPRDRTITWARYPRGRRHMSLRLSVTLARPPRWWKRPSVVIATPVRKSKRRQ